MTAGAGWNALAGSNLPILPTLPLVLEHLALRPNLVLQAPPGAGKTTGLPLALLDAPWAAERRLIMLEPRRLAARAAAARMAAMLGEAPGETVGYRMRQDTRIGPRTRIEVVTEGVLTRMIQDDPELGQVAAILFDEFHERSLNADLGLALCLDAQAALRPDLRLVVMSATVDGEAVAKLMGDAPIVTAEGRAYPVEVHWQGWDGRLEEGVARLIVRALDEGPPGDILAFLPGQGEIRRVERDLRERDLDVVIAPLFGDLPQAEQDRAIRPLAGRRKVVLATAIAETSLTIEGIGSVVDGGRARLPRFDPATGMSRLVTVPLSKASAEQRKGRAGRLGPGACFRLWTEADHRALPAFTQPEIGDADLAPLALELARWGVADAGALAWLEAPPAASLAQARALLADLGALDASGLISAHGRAMAGLGLHPRLAHMMLKAKDLGLGGLGADVAALLSERDLPLANKDADLCRRVEMLRAGGSFGVIPRVREAARQLRRQLSVAPDARPSPAEVGLMVAFAYPDRIAKRRAAQSLQYHMTNGQGAFFREPERLCTEEMLAVASLDGNRREARIFLAAPLTLSEVEGHFADAIVTEEDVAWDIREQQVGALRRRRLGRLVLGLSPLAAPDPALMAEAMLAGVKAMGLTCLPWTDEAMTLRARIAFLKSLNEAGWPDLSDQGLLSTMDDWLAPWLAGMTRRSHLSRLDMAKILLHRLDWAGQKELDALAPTHVTVPSGSRVAIDYSASPPVLAVRLQEMFGLADTPAVGGVKLVLHLLSPARRPVQVTQDLASFWAGAYRAVKADLKGQYPKHHWPDDPMQALPTARAKRRHE